MALENVVRSHQQQGKPLEKKPVYISFAFPDDRRLPWPPLSTSSAHNPDGDVDMDEDDNDEDDNAAEQERVLCRKR